MTDAEMQEGCELAKKYDVVSVCIKPYAVKMAAELLSCSKVQVGTVAIMEDAYRRFGLVSTDTLTNSIADTKGY
jgi:hypothetical protein